MTLIQDYGCFYKEYIFKNLSKFSSLLKSSYDKLLVNSLIVNLIVGFSKSFITKYIEENL